MESDLARAMAAAAAALAEAEAARGGSADAEFIASAILTAPAQFASREDELTVPAWALVALMRRVNETSLSDFLLRLARDADDQSRTRLKNVLPHRSMNPEFFDEYLDIIGGHHDGLQLDKRGALDYLANKYGLSDGAMYQRLNRELAARRQRGEMKKGVKILPRRPGTEPTGDKNP